jgi:AcrR family transcriptional regulator
MLETPWGEADTLLARRLRPGPGVAREVVAADQRERLFAALAVLADERGYQALRVEDLVALAGVSRGAFYEQFGSRDDCLLAAVTEIGELALRGMTAFGGDGAAGEQLRAAVQTLIGFATAYPAVARLWLVDAYGAGQATADKAGRGLDGVAAMVGAVASGEESTGVTGDELPPVAAHGLAGGLRRIVAVRLRERRQDELPTLAEPLVAWLAGYSPPTAPLRKPRNQAAGSGPRFTPHDQAERILLGVCEAVYEKGYAATTLADVAARASTSIRTFYAHYEGKEEAFIDAIDLAQVQSSAAALAASRRAPDWPHAVRNGINAICSYYATEPTLAEAVLVESHAAGRQALRRRDESIDSLSQLLEPGYELAPGTPPIVSEAIGGAVEALLHDAVRAGGGAKVRAVAATATFIALTPFLGAEQATEVANDIGQPRRRRT